MITSVFFVSVKRSLTYTCIFYFFFYTDIAMNNNQNIADLIGQWTVVYRQPSSDDLNVVKLNTA